MTVSDSLVSFLDLYNHLTKAILRICVAQIPSFLNIKNEYIFLVPYVPYYDLTQKVPMGFGSHLVVF